MTTKPELNIGSHLLPGLAAVALFVLMVVVFLTAPFGEATGFPEGANLTASIGYTMFNIDQGVGGDAFLAVFEIIDFVLVAALVGAVMLARRAPEGGESTLLADGGRLIREAITGEGED